MSNTQSKWTDQKKWAMGIVATLLTAAVVTFLFSPVRDKLFGRNEPADKETSNAVSAGALVVERQMAGHVMLGVIHISNERGLVFSPPAGKTEGDESPTETAIRETYEETGFTLKNVRFLEKAPAGNPYFSLVVAEIDDSVMKVNPTKHDGIGMIWADPTRIPPSNWRFPEQREWIINQFQEQVKKQP